ncbi:MAG: sugar ABC transporter ATP-binding protein [Clostridiales bacterium]|nr:sugar ABC transporter ATP-binding protein [Clostridiales bacterium]
MSMLRLELKNLHKRFLGVYAVNDVSLQVLPGEVHALVGENGAGKSTLVKMIIGEYTPDQGTIFHNGAEMKPRTISESIGNGIAMIHQELAPLPNMTIAENIFLGQEIMNGVFLNRKAMYDATIDILREYGLSFNPDKRVSELSVAQTQMLEIIKATRRNADVVIMDEPTSSLSNEEARKLFSIIDQLRKKNVSIIYISHRLEEIMALADNITVLRDGRLIDTVDAKSITQSRLVEMMVGRKLDQVYPKEKVDIGESVFSVDGLSSHRLFKDIRFEVRRGEILGFYGLVGAGRSEVMRAIFGIDRYDGGRMTLDGKEIRIASSKDAIDHRIALVSEDRRLFGLVLCRSIRENISLPNLYRYFRSLFIKRSLETQKVTEYEKALDIRCPSVDANAGSLSGGNQQKVVLAKWLMMKPEVMIMDEPTRGIDVGAKYEIYKAIVSLARQGMAVIMVSSELPEILGMSDRIIVMSKGRITGEFTREQVDSGRITQKDILNSSLEAM